MKLDELITGVKEVVPLPKAYIRIQALVNDPNSSLAEITQVIANDPGLTTRILRIANSAYLGLVSKVDTISRAVQVLGLNQVHDLALASAAVGSLVRIESKALNIYDFWRRSIYCAIVARLIAKGLGMRSPDRLFVSGLLHEIGNLILAFKDPELYGALYQAAVSAQQPLAEIERERLGFDYAEASAALLAQWQLPAALVQPVFYHTRALVGVPPEYAHDAGMIHLAAAISRAAMWRSEDDEPVPAFDPLAVQLTKLDDVYVEEIMSEADALVVEAMGLLVPDLKGGGRNPGARASA